MWHLVDAGKHIRASRARQRDVSPYRKRSARCIGVEAFGLEAAVSQNVHSATNHIDTNGACLVHLYRNDKRTPTSSEGLVVKG